MQLIGLLQTGIQYDFKFIFWLYSSLDTFLISSRPAIGVLPSKVKVRLPCNCQPLLMYLGLIMLPTAMSKPEQYDGFDISVEFGFDLHSFYYIAQRRHLLIIFWISVVSMFAG